MRKVEQERQIFTVIEPLLKKQIERQDEQGKALHMMFDGVTSMYSEFQEGMQEMKNMVQKVQDSVTLTNSECYEIQSVVASKSISLAKDRFHEEDGEFSKVVGKYRYMIWKHLKRHFNVPKYNCLRRVEFENAIRFTDSFRPEDFI